VDPLSILLDYADSFLGTPYIYGGKHRATGLDCSGFVCELLRSVGVLGFQENLNSQELYEKFEGNSCEYLSAAMAGNLLFFGPNVRQIDHVAMVRDRYRMIESAGGGEECTSIEVANQKGAGVRHRPIDYRKDFLLFCRVNYRWPS